MGDNQEGKTTEAVAPNRRKVLIVNPGFQYRFLAFTVAMAIVSASIFYGATAYFLHTLDSMAAQTGLPPGHAFSQYVVRQQTVAKAVFTILAVVVAVGLGIAGMIFSHRVAGPLLRLRDHLNALGAGGRLEPVHFRPEDYFRDLEQAFNAMVERFRKTN